MGPSHRWHSGVHNRQCTSFRHRLHAHLYRHLHQSSTSLLSVSCMLIAPGNCFTYLWCNLLAVCLWWIVTFLTYDFYCTSSYASTVLGVVFLSVCLCVCHTRALWQNQTMPCWHFDITWKGNHSSLLTPTVIGGRCSLPSKICTQSDSPPFEMCQLRQISAYNVSTITDSKKVQLWRMESQPRAFQRAIDGVGTLPLTCPSLPNGGSKRLKSAIKFLCVKTSIGKVVVWPFLYLTVHTHWHEM